MKEKYNSELKSLAFSLARISRINERFHMSVQSESPELLDENKAPAEYHVVLHLLTSEREELSPTQLCEYTLQTPGGMTKTLKRLENDGLILRFQSSVDARSLMVRLTPSGRQLAQRVMRATLSAYQEAFKDLSARQFSSMVSLLRLVRKTLERSMAK